MTTPLSWSNFYTGPLGIHQAVQDDTDPGKQTVALSSGWGAANASLLLTAMDSTNSNDPDLTTTLWVLDNNVASPNGGFGTRYPIFAFLGVNPIPTPSAPGAQVVNVVYEYDINSNAPAYAMNGVAMANSLASYLGNRLNQEERVLPVDENGESLVPDTGCAVTCTVGSGDDAIEFTNLGDGRYRFETVNGGSGDIEEHGTTTYVSYEADGLPLVEPLRAHGGTLGNSIADAVEDPLTDIVNYGYPNNDPIADPEVYTPAGLAPSPHETQQFVANLSEPDNNAPSTGLDELSASRESGQAEPEDAAPVLPRRPRPLVDIVRTGPKFSPGKSVQGGMQSTGSKRPTPIRDAIAGVTEAVSKITESLGGKHANPSTEDAQDQSG